MFMPIPENPYRKAMASLYMERYMGQSVDSKIKAEVDGHDGEKSLDYYIAAERFLSGAVSVLMKLDRENDSCKMFTMMLTYISYQIERFSAMKDQD